MSLTATTTLSVAQLFVVGNVRMPVLAKKKKIPPAAEAASAAAKSTKTNPGPKSKRGKANYIRCHAKDPSDGRSCGYSDGGQDKKKGVMRSTWNGRVDPMSGDKEHLCPRTIRAKTCPTGFRKDVLKVCNDPNRACVYARDRGWGLAAITEYYGREQQGMGDCAPSIVKGKCPRARRPS
jgi:hypothetical protein